MPITKYDYDAFENEMRKSLAIPMPHLDDVIDFIRRNLDPDDVFSDNQLENWAEKNGFVKEDT